MRAAQIVYNSKNGPPCSVVGVSTTQGASGVNGNSGSRKSGLYSRLFSCRPPGRVDFVTPLSRWGRVWERGWVPS